MPEPQAQCVVICDRYLNSDQVLVLSKVSSLLCRIWRAARECNAGRIEVAIGVSVALKTLTPETADFLADKDEAFQNDYFQDLILKQMEILNILPKSEKANHA